MRCACSRSLDQQQRTAPTAPSATRVSRPSCAAWGICLATWRTAAQRRISARIAPIVKPAQFLHRTRYCPCAGRSRGYFGQKKRGLTGVELSSATTIPTSHKRSVGFYLRRLASAAKFTFSGWLAPAILVDRHPNKNGLADDDLCFAHLLRRASRSDSGARHDTARRGWT